MTTSTIPEDVRAYLDAVRAGLGDLPSHERDDVMTDVEASVLESAEDSDVPVALRLGPPGRFAAELRAAAGLPPRADDAAAPEPVRPSLRELATRFTIAPWLRELAPLWWVARAVIVLGILAEATGTFDGNGNLPGEETRLLLPVAVVVSVALGLLRHRWRALVVALNVVCAIAAFPVGYGIAKNIREGDAFSSTQRGGAYAGAARSAPVPAAVRERRARAVALEAARRSRAENASRSRARTRAKKGRDAPRSTERRNRP